MRNAENIRAVEQLDIDWMGFIFYPGSARYVPPTDESAAAIRSCSKVKVGVFVNASHDEIIRTFAAYRLDYVQLHGNESPDDCRHLQEAGCNVIKAISVSSESDILQTSKYESVVDYFLFDTPPAPPLPGTQQTVYGGTGQRFDWSVLKSYHGHTPFLLSGGIGLEHLADLAAFRHPQLAGFDVNSRFELSPALKDTGKLKQFVCEARKFLSEN
ncbi:MAG: phosphoribosylanthranilate isomerase [Tannerella sp.]|nr:phosphoribosylanthranilate isomerase [Tannerella sp.]